MQGYLNAINDADLRTRAPILGDWTAQFGYYAGRELLTFRDFTAVFAANDQMALGVIHACHEAGIDVPGQVSVVGFDDVPEAAHFWPPLTTVRQDFAEIGRRAVAMLLDQIRGDIPAARAPIETQFIQRRSTGPAAF
jgi:DNA-binding LacI/PurR family transcriptional regulator